MEWPKQQQHWGQEQQQHAAAACTACAVDFVERREAAEAAAAATGAGGCKGVALLRMDIALNNMNVWFCIMLSGCVIALEEEQGAGRSSNGSNSDSKSWWVQGVDGWGMNVIP